MRCTESKRGLRAGFTLVEMLVVILIIAILVSLLSAVVSKALLKGKQVRNTSEISQMAVAIETFKSRFGFYPPSRIKLCERYQYYDLSNPGLDVDSVQTLQRMFPRINMNVWNDPANVGWMNWSGKPANVGP